MSMKNGDHRMKVMRWFWLIGRNEENETLDGSGGGSFGGRVSAGRGLREG